MKLKRGAKQLICSGLVQRLEECKEDFGRLWKARLGARGNGCTR